MRSAINFERLDADILRRLQRRAEGQPHRVPRVVTDQVRDRRFERRRKAHRLAIFGQDRRDSANRGKKSHVQHAVGFIEHQDLQAAEADQAAIEKIFEAARSGHDQTRSAAQRGQLVSFRQAAYDQGRGRQFRAAQGVVLIDHLHGQFARRNQHQGGDSGFSGIAFAG